MNQYKKISHNALQSMGLKPVSFSQVMAVSPAEAHERLMPYFEGLPVLPTSGRQAVWFRSLREMKRRWLGTNQKLDKDVAGLAIKLDYSIKISGLSLAPSDVSGVTNLCPLASKDCARACIGNTGQFSFDYSQALRTAKTRALVGDPVAFLRMLVAAIARESHNARRQGFGVGIRLNVLSDVPWEILAPWLFSYFADSTWRVHFYDYTKIPGRETPPNYRLTFSRSGRNLAHVRHELLRGVNVAVVFAYADLPSSFLGVPVIDGDLHDFRFGDPSGVIVGLKWKSPLRGGARRADVGPFVVWPAQAVGLDSGLESGSQRLSVLQ